MYAIRREPKQPVLPTGPNPMPPLSEFEVIKREFRPSLCATHGAYMVTVDLSREIGFFEHCRGVMTSQFWLAGHVLVESEHLLPADVRLALKSLSIEIA